MLRIVLHADFKLDDEMWGWNGDVSALAEILAEDLETVIEEAGGLEDMLVTVERV